MVQIDSAVDAIDVTSSFIEKEANGGISYNESSPDATLPNETLCLIFETAHALANVDGIPQNPLVEVAISHVCRRWRDVAISFPNLWTNFRYDACTGHRIARDRLTTYLQRSNLLPIVLWLRIGGDQKDSGEHLGLLESVIPHVGRWRRVTFFSDEDTSILGLVSQLRPLAAPYLEYFSMRPDMPPSGEFEDVGPVGMHGLSSQIFTAGAPKLSYVWLDASSSPRCLPPLSNVTVLRLEDRFRDPVAFMPWTTLLDILALPSLTSLSIFGQHFLPPDLGEDKAIAMNSLKHLRYGGDDESLPYFLPFLKAPLLETLVLHEVNTMMLPIHSPPTHIFTGVRKLDIFNCEFPDPTALPWLASMIPNVTDLKVSHNGGQQLVEIININFKDRVIWSQLETVTCNFFNCDGIGCYIGFVSYCLRVLGKPLKCLKVSSRLIEEWRSTQSSNNIKEMQQLCDLIEVLPQGSQLFAPWPPGVGVFDEAEDDLFTQAVY